MADDESIFDPTLKKKKKKKTGFNIDAAMSDIPPPGSEAPDIATENGLNSEYKETVDDVNDDLELLGKKKKKKKPFNLDSLKDAIPDYQEGAEDGEERTTFSVDDLGLDMDFSKMVKKKKKSKKGVLGLEEIIADGEKDEDNDDKENVSKEGWYDSDRDYTYDELLQRAFNQLRERNPDMATGEKKKFVMKPPQVVRIGSKKTAFANFSEICRLLHRTPKHLLMFLLAELGTSGSTDGNNQLIIKGRFQQKQIENVLRRYIKEYVTCHTCRSPDTILQKDARLYFLQCEQCNSRCSVAPIKSGFQAVANKQQRQAIRASKN